LDRILDEIKPVVAKNRNLDFRMISGKAGHGVLHARQLLAGPRDLIVRPGLSKMRSAPGR
jgi:hypothetical protein